MGPILACHYTNFSVENLVVKFGVYNDTIRKDNANNHVALITRSVLEKTGFDDVSQHVPEDIYLGDHKNVPAHDRDSSDGEDLIEEAPIESYKAMYKKWVQIVK